MGKLKTYHQNDMIFCQGDESKSMFIVRKGRVGVILDRGSDHENFLAELLSGQFLGEMGMLDSQRPSSPGSRTEEMASRSRLKGKRPGKLSTLGMSIHPHPPDENSFRHRKLQKSKRRCCHERCLLNDSFLACDRRVWPMW